MTNILAIAKLCEIFALGTTAVLLILFLIFYFFGWALDEDEEPFTLARKQAWAIWPICVVTVAAVLVYLTVIMNAFPRYDQTYRGGIATIVGGLIITALSIFCMFKMRKKQMVEADLLFPD